MYQKLFITNPLTDRWKGPHEGDEAYLFENCGKRFGIASYKHVHKFYESPIRHELIMLPEPSTGQTFVFRFEDLHLYNMYVKALTMFHSGAIHHRTYLIRLGRLFGYHKEHIIEFLKQFPFEGVHYGPHKAAVEAQREAA